jgi:hypothetical protein
MIFKQSAPLEEGGGNPNLSCKFSGADPCTPCMFVVLFSFVLCVVVVILLWWWLRWCVSANIFPHNQQRLQTVDLKLITETITDPRLTLPQSAKGSTTLFCGCCFGPPTFIFAPHHLLAEPFLSQCFHLNGQYFGMDQLLVLPGGVWMGFIFPAGNLPYPPLCRDLGSIPENTAAEWSMAMVVVATVVPERSVIT